MTPGSGGRILAVIGFSDQAEEGACLLSRDMPSLKGNETEQNLKDAFAGESQANCRYLYFAQKADVEGFNVVAAVFRSTAEGETGHAHGHLEYLKEVDDPATGKPIGPTGNNLKAAIASGTYPGMARVARQEGALEENWNTIGGKHGRKD